MLCPKKHRRLVYPANRFEVVGLQLGGFCDRPNYTCVVHQDRYRAESVLGTLHNPRPVGFAAYIVAQEKRVSTKLGFKPLAIIFIDIGKDDFCSFRKEPTAMFCAHSSGGPCNDCNFAFKSHITSPITEI